jgi:hypothetical protein
MLTIAPPPPARIAGISYLIGRKTPLALLVAGCGDDGGAGRGEGRRGGGTDATAGRP